MRRIGSRTYPSRRTSSPSRWTSSGRERVCVCEREKERERERESLMVAGERGGEGWVVRREYWVRMVKGSRGRRGGVG